MIRPIRGFLPSSMGQGRTFDFSPRCSAFQLAARGMPH